MQEIIWRLSRYTVVWQVGELDAGQGSNRCLDSIHISLYNIYLQIHILGERSGEPPC